MNLPDLPITAFAIRNEIEGISLAIEELCGFPDRTVWTGGFETKGVLEITAGSYYYTGRLYISTGELSSFYDQLDSCYNKLSGSATLYNREENTFYLEVTAGKRGGIICKGWSCDDPSKDNKLSFEIHTDQTFLLPAIQDLKVVTEIIK